MECVTSIYCNYQIFDIVSISDCLECPIEGQIREDCASPASCHRTCDNLGENILCPSVCVNNGCECPAGTVIDEDKEKCVAPRECQSMSTNCCVNVMLYCTKRGTSYLCSLYVVSLQQ